MTRYQLLCPECVLATDAILTFLSVFLPMLLFLSPLVVILFATCQVVFVVALLSVH